MSAAGASPAIDRSAVDLSTVDLLDAGLHDRDPHAIWSYMRAHAPLHRQEFAPGRSFVSVTGYGDACRVLGDHESFTSERGTVITQLGTDDIASGLLMTSCDPPRHTEVRRPLNNRLTAGAVRTMEDGIRDAVRLLFDDVPDGEPWDLAGRAFRLPMVVAGRLIGVPESGWDDLVSWTSMAAAPEDPVFAVGPRHATLSISHHRIFSYFQDLVRSRRESADPGTDDLIRHLMTMPVGGAALTEQEIVYNAYSLLLGANVTTPQTLAGTLLALAAGGDGDPDAWSAARADPDLVPGLVEEGLRWTSAASSFMRYARRPCELSGGPVDTGEPVVVWLGAANRDPSEFPDPDVFDIRRRPNRHIAFGYGPHYCIGAPLARLTLRHTFAYLLERFASVELAGPPRRQRSAFINGLTSLPVLTRSGSRA
ncbi:MAG: cytochrome P450 [Catenulispora sp.]